MSDKDRLLLLAKAKKKKLELEQQQKGSGKSPLRQVGDMVGKLQQASLAAAQGMESAFAGLGGAAMDAGAALRGDESKPGAQMQRQVEAEQTPLPDTGVNKAARVAGGALPAFLTPGPGVLANATMGALFGAGASPDDRLTGAAIGAGAAATGPAISNRLNTRAIRLQEEAAQLQASNAVRDQTWQQGRQAGYVTVPSVTNPGLRNSAAEGYAGRPTLEDMAAVRNQRTTDGLARQTLGLPPDAPLTPHTFEQIRRAAGNVYREIGAVGNIAADQQYIDDIIELTTTAEEIRRAAPAVARRINRTVEDVLEQNWDSRTIVRTVQQLRAQAASNMRQGPQYSAERESLGRVQREAAEILDDLIGRNLQQQGHAELYAQWAPARQLIARSHAVENATNEAGHVVANRISAQGRRGAPLADELDLVARMAGSFPREMRSIESVRPQVSGMDFTLSGIGGGITAYTHDPKAIALAMAYTGGRIGARHVALSPLGQALLAQPNYNPTVAPLVAASYLSRGILPGSLELAKQINAREDEKEQEGGGPVTTN